MRQKIESIVRDQCARVSGSDDAFNEIVQAKVDLKKCFQNEFNTTQLSEEFALAKQTGNFTMVFNK
jgi:hypothetical protein